MWSNNLLHQDLQICYRTPRSSRMLTTMLDVGSVVWLHQCYFFLFYSTDSQDDQEKRYNIPSWFYYHTFQSMQRHSSFALSMNNITWALFISKSTEYKLQCTDLENYAVKLSLMHFNVWNYRYISSSEVLAFVKCEAVLATVFSRLR